MNRQLSITQNTPVQQAMETPAFEYPCDVKFTLFIQMFIIILALKCQFILLLKDTSYLQGSGMFLKIDTELSLCFFSMFFIILFHYHIFICNLVFIYLKRWIIRSLVDNNLFQTCGETKATQEKLVFQDEECVTFVDHRFQKFPTKLSLFKTKLKCIQKGTLSHNSWVLTN